MTDAELTALAALANAATPGPWHGEHGELLHTTLAPTKRHPDRAYTNALAWVEETDHASGEYLVRLMDTDAAYIAAMHPGTVLGLIAEVRRLRGIAESCDAWKWECEQCNAENRGLRGALNRALSTSREEAEVQRLRALVESAFAEGQAATDGRYEYGWDDSASRKALDPR